MANKGPGQPTKYTPQTRNKILRALRAGSTRKMACLVAGVSTSTFGTWLNEYPAFLESVQQAEAYVGVTALQELEAARAKGDVASSRWLLERKFPDDFGKRVDLRVAYSNEQASGLIEIIRRMIVKLPSADQDEALAWLEIVESGLQLPEEGEALALPEEVDE